MDSRSEFSLPLLRDRFFRGRISGHNIIDFGICHVCKNPKLICEYKPLAGESELKFPPVCFNCIFAYCACDNGVICLSCVHYGFINDETFRVGNGKGLCISCCGNDIKIVDDINEMRNLVSYFSGGQYVDDIMCLIFTKNKSPQT